MSVATHQIQNRTVRKRKSQWGYLLLHAGMILLGFTFLIPLAWVVSTSLKTSGEVFITPVEWIPKSPNWSNYTEVFVRLPFTQFIINSLYVSVMGTLGSVISAILVAFGLSRIRWPGRDALFGVLLATLMLPGIVTLIPVFIIFKNINWIGTFLPLWVPAWFGSAFYIFLMRQFCSHCRKNWTKLPASTAPLTFVSSGK